MSGDVQYHKLPQHWLLRYILASSLSSEFWETHYTDYSTAKEACT